MASTGIGTGIGIGLGEIGDTLEKRREEKLGLRDKQADTLHTKAIQIGTNLLNSGYKVAMDPTTKQPSLIDLKTGTAAQNPNADVSSMFNEYLNTSKQAQALYPPHETGALIQHFRKFMGKQAKPPQPDPRAAGLTPQGMASEVPVPKPPVQQYTGDVGQVVQALKASSDPSLSPEQRAAAKSEYDRMTKSADVQWQKSGEPYLDKTTGRYYQPYVDPKDPSKQKTVQLAAHFQPTGTAKAEAGKTPEAQIAAEAKMWSDNGIIPPAKTRGEVQQYMVDHQLSPHAPKVSDFGQFVKLEYGDKPSAQQLEKAHQQWTGQGAETVGTHVIQVPQPDGSIKSYEVTTSSQKILPGQGGVSTPGQAKDKLKELGTTGGRKTPAQNKADSEYGEAVKTAAQADNAVHAKSSVQDKLLIESLVKGASGRFSQASYDNVVGKTGLGNKLEQLYNNVAGGGQLPDDVRAQAVKAAHDLVTASDAARKALATPTGDSEIDDLVNELQKLK